jgi:uncharacterized protein (DUF2062 family)
VNADVGHIDAHRRQRPDFDHRRQRTIDIGSVVLHGLTAQDCHVQHVLSRLALIDMNAFGRPLVVTMIVCCRAVLMLVVLVIPVGVYVAARIGAQERERRKHKQDGCQPMH